MYESLKPWMDVDVTIKPFLKRSGTGEKLFGSPYTVKCYPQGEVSIVRNWQGVEVVSHNRLHMDGNTQITKLDSVVFEGEELPVQAISVFYRRGVPDIKVVFV